MPPSGFQLTPSPQTVASEDPPNEEENSSADGSLLAGDPPNDSSTPLMPSAASTPGIDTSANFALAAFSRIVSNLTKKEKERKQKEESTTPPNEGDDPEKRPRPKRGQYRCVSQILGK